MSTPDVRQPGLLALGSKVWLAELTTELVRLGHSQDEASRAAKRVLVHIVSRAQWPREAYLVDDRMVD